MFNHRFFLYVLLAASLLGLMVVPSCNKQDFNQTSSATSNTLTSDRGGDALSEQAFNEVVSEQYEQQGKFVYDHLRYRFATTSPENYVPDGLRQNYLQVLGQQKSANANKSAAQLVDEYVKEGVLTQNERNLLSSLHQTIASMENDANLTFGQAWFALRNWEIATMGNASVQADEKTPALIISSALRNMLKFEYENGEIADDRGNGCFLGRKLSCWENALTKAALDSLKATLGLVYPLLTGGSIDWGKVKKEAWKIGGISLVIEVVKIFLDDNCKCGSEDPNPVVACATPQGISMRLGDCNTQEQTFETWGYGTSPGTFTWIIENGYFPDYGPNAMIATTISPSIKVHQNNPNVPVKLTVAASCNGISIPALDFSIPNLVNDPGTLNITGYNEVGINPLHTEHYFFWGSWRTSQNSVIFYSGCTPHGTVIARGTDYIDIQWNSTSPSYPTPTVTAIAKNICSNLSTTSNLYVTLH